MLEQLSEQTEKLSPSTRTFALLAICTGYFMVILDTTIVTVALPSIEHQFITNVSALQWVVDGYSLVFASLLLTAGVLGDRLGNRRVFLAGLLLFIVSSILCGASPSLDMLILARIIQGAGAALLVPTSLALLSQLFPEAQSRARAIGIWGSVAGIGAASGPVIGGLLVNTLSWRSIFLINAPVGLLGFWFTLRLISPSQPQQTRGFDSAAQVIAILGLAALTFALIEGATLGWPIILMLIATFILAAVIFILIERRVQQPMLPLTLFSSATFSAGNIVGLLLNMGFYGQLFVINLFFQQILNYPSLQTGLALLPETGTVLLSSMLSGRITGQVGPRLPMIIGPAVGCAGFCAMALVGTTTPYILTIVMLAAMGFGLAFAMPAMTAAVISAAPPERSGIASGALNANRQVGGVLGVALLGSLVGQRTSFVSGMHGAMLIAAATFFISFLLSLLLVKNPSARRA